MPRPGAGVSHLHQSSTLMGSWWWAPLGAALELLSRAFTSPVFAQFPDKSDRNLPPNPIFAFLPSPQSLWLCQGWKWLCFGRICSLQICWLFFSLVVFWLHRTGVFCIWICGDVHHSLILSFFLVPVTFHPCGKHIIPLSKTRTGLGWGWRSGWSSFRKGQFGSIYEQSTENELSRGGSQLILLLTGAFSPFDSPKAWCLFLKHFKFVFSQLLVSWYLICVSIPVFLSDNLFYSTIFSSAITCFSLFKTFFPPATYLTKLVIPSSPLHFFAGRNFTSTLAISWFEIPLFLLSSLSCSRALIRSINQLPEVPGVSFLKPLCFCFAFFLPSHLRIINYWPFLTTLWVDFSPSFFIRIKHEPSVLPVAFPISQGNYFALKQPLENWNPRPLQNWDPAGAVAQVLWGCFKVP